MSIRLATISDAESIRDIYQAAITAIPKRPDINIGQKTFWLTSGADISRWEDIINSQNVAVYVEDSIVVGFVSVLDDFLKYIYVHPDYTGNGIGFKLIEWAEQFAENNGIETIQTHCTSLAHHLFTQRGFTKINEIAKSIPGTASFIFHHFTKDLKTKLSVNKAEGVIQPSIEVKSNHLS